MNKKKIFIIILLSTIFLGCVFCIAFSLKSVNQKNYELANEYFNNHQYTEAQNIYYRLGRYKDSERLLDMVMKCIEKKNIYDDALYDYQNGDYESALDKLYNISDFEDSKEQIIKIIYALAKKYFYGNQFREARKYFLQLEGYKDSEDYLLRIDAKLADVSKELAYKDASTYLNNEQYSKAIKLFNDLGEYSDSEEQAVLCEEMWRKKLSHIISCGTLNSFGLKSDEHVMVAGDNRFGQYNAEEWESIVSIDSYGGCVIGLTSDGKVKIIGKMSEERIDNTSEWENIVDIASGDLHVVALKSDGTVVAEGHKIQGQCNVADWKNVVDIDAGWSYTVGLTEDGELLFAGKITDDMTNDYLATMEEWKDVVKISASGGDPFQEHTNRGKGHVVGLTTDGHVIAIGDNSEKQCDVRNWENVIAIAAGDWFTVGLTESGDVLITGDNLPGSKYIEYEKWNKWKKIREIAAGYGIILVVTEDGSVDAMGFDEYNQRTDAIRWSEKITSRVNKMLVEEQEE